MQIFIVAAVFISLLIGVKLWQVYNQKQGSLKFNQAQAKAVVQLSPKQQLSLLLKQMLGEQYHVHQDVLVSQLLDVEDRVLKKYSQQKALDAVVTDLTGKVVVVFELALDESAKQQREWLKSLMQGRFALIRITQTEHISQSALAKVLDNLAIT
ncbi:hypothetical protein DS2_04570 [Catenovulum agarivorans DS-2]|uniref:DUF2726 domain-containing protein n=1 Tax=Catenovulum agarivorans DS-2 TaxID=1328313 RepID=W7QEU7_9ALTE|nr:hypothetical protein [Catenovulum agarivorans]EWH11419.1 hypothetical protein DS2_04570 [Catenovulum agarivorans DS-2]